MRPYYDSDGITIYHGDCREVLPHVEDGYGDGDGDGDGYGPVDGGGV